MIKVHQVLHGYADGHRLLRASLPLNAGDARALLTMSDVSGPNAIIPEEGYLTGYPLTGLGMYAIARTWPADELPRPGSVWTHTLLVDFSDLATLPNPGGLSMLHARPSGFRFDRYDTPIVTDISSIANVPCGHRIGELSREIIAALYSKSKYAIVAPTTASAEYELVVMAIWGQQWPKLRRSFRFCTLSFGDRSMENMRFDLQFIPPSLQRSIARIPEILLVDPISQETKSIPWLEHTTEDIISPNTSFFRDFLKSEGATLNSTREAFRPLAAIHHLITHIEQPGGINLAVEAIDQLFGQGHAVNARLMIAKTALERITEMQEGAINFVLDHINLIDPSFLDEHSYPLAQKIWESSPSMLTDLLNKNSAGINIAEKGLEKLPSATLIDGIERDNKTVTSVLAYRPDLVTQPLFWKLYGISEKPGFQVISARPDLHQQAFHAITEANRPDLSSTACEKCGHALALQIISEKSHTINSSINLHREIWITAAVSNSIEISKFFISSEKINPEFLEEISHYVPQILSKLSTIQILGLLQSLDAIKL
ncbi:hypothetical protein [Chromobacterium sp. Beijing]|uniref:GAP1-N1 domain-containing protein n=1 Tax=Chromobacterium sp. Beijing TaxID=2735795 RepID=UPI001F1904DD|nr:hypothetical protein [Chromobacterium sp. Beijing]UJB33415.1 hypothetical protein HQN78_21505 [Chromobacterium sp. Beijing]